MANLIEKLADLKPSAESDYAHSDDEAERKEIVLAKYQEAIEAKKHDHDRVTYVGEDLATLDPNLVVLDSNLRENPRSWKPKEKWTTTMIIGGYCFLAPFTSTIFAPSIPSVMASTGETNPTKGALHISVFLFAFAIAPLIEAPLSEIFGRQKVVRCGNWFFLIFCVGCGFCRTTAQLAVCRFFAGVGGGAALAVYGGVLADIFNLKERASASGVLAGIIILGPVLGPLCGGWMSEKTSWRWTCWVPACAAGALELTATFFLKESYIPTLLRQKLAKTKKERPHAYTVLDLRDSLHQVSSTKYLTREILRPLTYLFLDPALSLLSWYFAVIFGILYLVIVTFYSIFGIGYHHSTGIVGVDLLAQGLGAIIGMMVTVRVLRVVHARKMKSKEGYTPESRLIAAFAGAFIVATGLFVYGFTALRTHFMVPLIGVAIFSFGTMNVFLAIQLYCIDSFDYPASALSALSTLRCLLGGAFPLFGQKLFDALGVDWGVGLLAFLSLGLGAPILPLVWKFGPRLRAAGKRNRERFN